MDQVTKRSTNGTRLAVSRDYQPARIERELLAQIFDLVDRGARNDSEPYDAPQEQVVTAMLSTRRGECRYPDVRKGGRNQ